MTETESKGDNCAGLVVLDGCPDDVGVRAEEEGNVTRGRLGEKVGVDGGWGGEGEEFGVLSLDRRDANMRVLQVRTSVAFERQHACPVERIVVDAAQPT